MLRRVGAGDDGLEVFARPTVIMEARALLAHITEASAPYAHAIFSIETVDLYIHQFCGDFYPT